MILIAIINTILITVFNTILIAIINMIFIVGNNAGKTTGILRLFKSNSSYCSCQPTSERTHALLASPSQ